MSQAIEELSNHTFPFSLGRSMDVFENLEYPWGFDRTLLVLPGLLNVCQFLLVITLFKEIRLIRTAATAAPVTDVASA